MQQLTQDRLVELMHRVLPKIYVGDSDCWEWLGAHIPQGYGTLNFCGKTVRAHRAVWTAYFGEIADNLCVLHKCDNPGCVRPSHLFLGSDQDNYDDMENKGRRGRPGVKLTKEQVQQIRLMLLSDRHTLRDIGDKFGVTLTCIHQIKSGANWNWLPWPHQ